MKQNCAVSRTSSSFSSLPSVQKLKHLNPDAQVFSALLFVPAERFFFIIYIYFFPCKDVSFADWNWGFEDWLKFKMIWGMMNISLILALNCSISWRSTQYSTYLYTLFIKYDIATENLIYMTINEGYIEKFTRNLLCFTQNKSKEVFKYRIHLDLISTMCFCMGSFQDGVYIMQTSGQKSKDNLVSAWCLISVRDVTLNSHFTSCTLQIEICAFAFSCYL